MILSKEIDKLIDLVKFSTHIPYSKIELDIYKTKKLEKIQHFKEIVQIKLLDLISKQAKVKIKRYLILTKAISRIYWRSQEIYGN